ncbi:MAG: adenylate kinase [candidate division KSB1 bacterium]|jgi:adenylate kinase|nr:adenylate kinase [candidate division KSB1 bacterium]
MQIIMLGAPGTGKGTQGNLLSNYFGIPNISTGEILRSAVKQESPLGIKAKLYMDAGELVPDDVMIGIIRDRLREADCEKGFILDGFPRTVTQAEALDHLLSGEKIDIEHVIALEVAENALVMRLTSRRVCSVCGKDYNMLSDPPPGDMKCRMCGGEIIQRSDDNETTVTKRLAVYEEKTAPLKEYYERQSKLRHVIGAGSVEEVQDRIREILHTS